MKNEIHKSNTRTIKAISKTVIRHLENPPLSKRAKEKKLEVKSSNKYGKVLKGDDARLFTLADIEKFPLIANDLGESQKRKLTGHVMRELSEHDKLDVYQEIACCLLDHNIKFHDSNSLEDVSVDNDELAQVIGTKEFKGETVNLTVWHAIFSRCRKLLRLDHRLEYYADRIDAYSPDDLLKLETNRPYTLHPCSMEKIKLNNQGQVISHEAITSPVRKKLATQAKLYKRALAQAFKVDTSRKAKSKLLSARQFLKASISTVNGNGHGLDQMTHQKRYEKKKAFLSYLATGLEAMNGKMTLDEIGILMESKISA